jgi:hypothetical protein
VHYSSASPSAHDAIRTLPRLVGVENQKMHKGKDMPAECRDMSACDWVAIASPPHGLSIVVAFPTGWVNTGGPGGSFLG